MSHGLGAAGRRPRQRPVAEEPADRERLRVGAGGNAPAEDQVGLVRCGLDHGAAAPHPSSGCGGRARRTSSPPSPCSSAALHPGRPTPGRRRRLIARAAQVRRRRADVLVDAVRGEAEERLTVVAQHDDRLAAVVDELEPVVAAEHARRCTPSTGGSKAADGRDVADAAPGRPVRSCHRGEHRDEHGDEHDRGAKSAANPRSEGDSREGGRAATAAVCRNAAGPEARTRLKRGWRARLQPRVLAGWP